MRTLVLLAVAGTSMLSGAAVNAADVDFANPAVALSQRAVIASGTCIGRNSIRLDDQTRPAAEIGQKVAQRCAKEIATSAGLASWMVGRPEDFERNLHYVRDDLTTATVVRLRAAHPRKF